MIITDNKDRLELLEHHFDNIVEFLKTPEAQAIFPKPKKIGNNDWGQIQSEVEELYGPVHPLYGKCFHSAKFVLHFGGGKKHFDLKLIKSFKFCKEGFTTTHWFVRHKATGKFFDPTGEQFCYPGFEYNKDDHMIQKWYKAKNGDFGFKWVKRNGPRFDEVAPSRVSMELGDLYESMYGTQGGLSWWKQYR